jgi:ABC-type microcin C transport system permease subunit YejB
LDFIVEKLSVAIGIGMIGIFLILLILIPVALIKRK